MDNPSRTAYSVLRLLRTKTTCVPPGTPLENQNDTGRVAAPPPILSHIHPRPPDLLFQNTFETVYDSTRRARTARSGQHQSNKAQHRTRHTARRLPLYGDSAAPPEVAFTLSFPPGLLLLPSLSPVFSCPPKISRRPACDPSHIPHTQAFLEHFLPITSTSTRFINNSIVTFGYFGLRLEELGTLTIASNQLLNPFTTVCATWERLDSYPRFSPPPSARPSPGTRVVRRQQLDAYVNRHCESTDDCEAYSMASVRE